MQILFWLIFIACLAYGMMLFFFIVGVWRLKDNALRESSDNPADLPSLSIIIPAHNEEKHLKETLAALYCQDYPGKWEAIFIDDRSTDGSAILLDKAVEKDRRLRVIHIPVDSPYHASPKKRALKEGFESARNEILMTMDADCRPTPAWLRSMAANFHSDVDIVQGPKKIIGSDSFLHRFQALDTLGFTLIEAACFTNGMPMLASAPSLAYRRCVYEKSGGFEGIEDLASGDDDMLVHRMANIARKIAYNLDPYAQVGTSPVESWAELFNQRARWASNGSNYENKAYILLLLFVFFFIVWLGISPFLLLFGWISWPLVLFPWLLRAGLDYSFMAIGAPKLKSSSLLKDFLPVLIIQIPLIVYAVIAGQLGWYRWKGQRGRS